MNSHMSPNCPALLIAAPASGQGKTTVTAALARLLTRRGKRVRVFKCGPDFLDPYWHSLASGAPVYQLDLWMTGEADCRARLAHAAHSADVILPVQHTQTTTAGGWLGALPRSPAFSLPERHLGLTMATELPDALARVDAVADALAQTPLGQMDDAAWQRWQVTFDAPSAAENTPHAHRLEGRTIAIARDAAFCFIYAANLDCLESMGARLVFFSPLSDSALPDCDALWLPGGYPELHAELLANNTSMQRSVQAHVAAGKPVWAECGGMMALFEQLSTADGARYALWGILPGHVTMQKRLAALGPQQLDWLGESLRGHTFHYSTTRTALTAVARTAPPGHVPAIDQGEAVWQQGAVRASYFHAWFASSPCATAALFTKET